MISGKTKSGFDFAIDETVLDDMRFFEDLAEADENPLKIVKVTKRLLGDEQKERLYQFLEEKNGKATTEAFSEALVDIMTEASETSKNS